MAERVTTKDRLELFYAMWSKRVDRGQSSGIDRCEEIMLECFAEWCDKQIAKEERAARKSARG
jgi:hypothetical protein